MRAVAETVRERIKRHEGLRLEPYRDTQGNWTVGYGHRLPATAEAAEHVLNLDVANAEHGVTMVLLHLMPGQTMSLDHRRRDVLVEMCFQLGQRGLRGFRKMLAAVKENDYALAADEMLDSAWARQTPERARELADIMRTA